MARIPEIIAHRGTPREYLENTIDSFRRAIAQGADAIELDVHATSDGVAVVHHDPVLRVSTGAASDLVPIVSMTADEVARVTLAGGAQVPTLDQVLDLVRAEGGAHVTMYVEVKAPVIEDVLIACLDRHPDVRTAVHAFDHRIPVAVRDRRPGTAIGLLSTSYPVRLEGFVGGTGASAFWQQGQLIDAALVRDAHTLGMRLIAWTVNDPAHAARLVGLGVDALCTDVPGFLRSALGG